MRTARKLLLVATAAVAMLAMTAGAASAQVEIREEADNAHCSTTNICHLHVVGTSMLSTHSGGVETTVSQCVDEYEGTTNEAGEGNITHISLTGVGCNSVACANASGQVPWPFHLIEDSGTLLFTAEFCLFNSLGQFSFCDVEGIVTEGADHNYTLSVDDFTCPSGVEVDGDWTIERDGVSTSEGIEIIH